MNGSTITNVLALAFGVAMVTTLVASKNTPAVLDAGGKAASRLVLASLGQKA